MKNFKVIFFCLLMAMTTSSPAQSYWEKNFGGDGDYFSAISLPLSNGSALIAGGKYSGNTLGTFVIKISPTCDIVWETIWSRFFIKTMREPPAAMVEQSDKSVLVAMSSFNDIWLLKINTDGDTVWTKTFTSTYSCRPVSMLALADGSTIIAAWKQTRDTVDYPGNIWLLKINTLGDTVWTRTIGGYYDECAGLLGQLSDGTIVALGITTSTIDKNSDVIVIKIDPKGTILSTKTYGGPKDDYAVSMEVQSNGSLLIAGCTKSFGNGQNDFWLIKLNDAGDTAWTKAYGTADNEELSGMLPHPDGSKLLYGFKGSTDTIKTVLIKTTGEGDIIWEKHYSLEDGLGAAMVSAVQDGYYIITTKSVAGDSTKKAANIVKVNAQGDSLWTKWLHTNHENYISSVIPRNGFPPLISGYSLRNIEDMHRPWMCTIMDDCNTETEVPFCFRIPVSGDSLQHTYTPIHVPSSMTVSKGGTISWIPKADKSYRENVSFVVSGTRATPDTLTFNIWVNANPTGVCSKLPSSGDAPGMSIISSKGQAGLRFPAGASAIALYSLNGVRVASLIPAAEGVMVWMGCQEKEFSAGLYVVKYNVNGKIHTQSMIIDR